MIRSTLPTGKVSALTLFFLLILLAGIMCFSACIIIQSKPGPLVITEEPRKEENLAWEILDYHDKASGGSIPVWLSSYLEGGINAVEKLEEFSNYFVFIGMNSGGNFNALEQWNESFLPELDFARLVTVRIEKRLLAAVKTYPDDEFGSYFIALIRSASDALWNGAERDSDFWLLRSFPEADDMVISRESFDFFILVKIRKPLLTTQIRRLFENIKPELPLTADQQTAVNLVQERFFEGF